MSGQFTSVSQWFETKSWIFETQDG